MRIIDRLRRAFRRDAIVVKNTGSVTETGDGRVNSGYSSLRRPGRRVRVRATGNATATGPGSSANSGINWGD